MFASHNQAIYNYLWEQRIVPRAQLELANEEAKTTGKPLADVLIDFGLVDKSGLLEKLAEHLGYRFLAEVPPSLPDAALAALPAPLARNYRVVPWAADAHRVHLLASDPFNHHIVDDLAFALGCDVRLIVGDPDRVEQLIQRYYGEDEAKLNELAEEIATAETADTGQELSAEDIEAIAGQAPVVRFVNLVLAQAIRDQASDLHFEPFEHDFKIRYRLDGVLYEMMPPPKRLALPIASRLKVMANLDIAERRAPQDGRMKVNVAGRSIDLRISTLPTQFGESVVLRVLDRSAVRLDLTQLGLPPNVLEGVQEMIRRPNGIFIVTGPTGSGKTTTLYSGLQAINTPGIKLLTAEDPVEYEIEGVMQTAMNPLAGLTFASALRSFLRQDPDVIMVGEIRDLETAQIAIQASLTGHLVLSTLHTNDAVGAVTRLMDMGVEPFQIASTVEAVLAQRLVRRICPHCRTTCRPTDELLAQLGLDSQNADDRHFFRGRGCERCHRTGYQGRMGVFEWLRVTEPIRELVIRKTPAFLIRQKAIEQGLCTLREDGLRAIFDGLTTVEEVAKYT